MINFSKVCDAIFVISMDDRLDKFMKVYNQWSDKVDVPIIRYSGVNVRHLTDEDLERKVYPVALYNEEYWKITDPKRKNIRGMIGCAAAHANVLSSAMQQFKRIAVFEDDAILNTSEDNFNRMLSTLPDEFDMAYLYVQWPKVEKRVKIDVDKINADWMQLNSGGLTTTAYIINLENVKLVNDIVMTLETPVLIDWFMALEIQKRYNVVAPYHRPVYTNGFEQSDIIEDTLYDESYFSHNPHVHDVMTNEPINLDLDEVSSDPCIDLMLNDDNLKRTLNLFWHDDNDSDQLPYYVQACIATQLAAGYDVRLWSYKQYDTEFAQPLVQSTMSKFENMSATRILDIEPFQTFRHNSKTYSTFSNIFRYVLLYKLGGWWFDTDVAVSNAFIPTKKIELFKERKQDGTFYINNCNMYVDEQYSDFMSLVLNEALRRLRETTDYVNTSGPRLLRDIVEQHPEIQQYVNSDKVWYEINWDEAHILTEPLSDVVYSRLEQSGVHGIHLWNSVLQLSNKTAKDVDSFSIVGHIFKQFDNIYIK